MAEGETTVVSSLCYIPDDQPVVALDAETAFESLTQREKLNAHHLSTACHVGGLVVLLAQDLRRRGHRVPQADRALRGCRGEGVQDVSRLLLRCSYLAHLQKKFSEL
jgi:hypothetical protein